MTKRWKGYVLPDFVKFEGFKKPCFYDILGFRCPNKGEYFLSGAIVEAYCARQHMTREYVVVRPSYFAVSGERGAIKGQEVYPHDIELAQDNAKP